MARIYIGLSGYAYKPWQGEGRFYPVGLKQKEFFAYYADHFEAVEMDGTWYQMPSEKSVAAWIAQCPEGFKYTFKVHRQVSHFSRLQETAIDPMKFFADRLKPAVEAGVVGCIYIQLPPNLKRTDDRLEKFLPHLPQGPAWGIEFRHETWNTDDVEEILRTHGVAFVASDMDELKGVRRDTGSVIYSRMRRENYTDEDMASWAHWFHEKCESGKDVFVFMKHEDDGSPWVDAERLRGALSILDS